MNAIRIRKTLNDLEFPELRHLIGKTVEIIVLEETPNLVEDEGPKAGSARGMVTMADDFDAPLDEFEDYM